MVEQVAQTSGPGMSLDNAFALFILMLVAQVPILVTAIVAFLKNRQAITENTRITKHGSTVAGENAKEAAEATKETKQAVEGINKKLNGGIDDAVMKAIKPLQVCLDAHVEKDAKDLAEIKTKFDELFKYAHDRNHDMLNAMQTLTMQNELILEKLKDKK